MVDKPTFAIGDHVEKISGSSWRGRIVGTYATDLTREGYAVESDTEKGSVQIYPAKALRLAAPANGEQVERADVDVLNLRAERAAGNIPTPTEDARERVKVLERLDRVAYDLAMAAGQLVVGTDEMTDLRKERVAVLDALRTYADARATALGNKETDRHG